MEPPETAPTTTRKRGGAGTSVIGLVAWFLTGTAGALGLVSLGPILVAPAVVLAGVLASRPAARHGRAGLPAGAGLVFLAIAYVQRHGPGTTCWRTATASACDQTLNPIPWLVLAVLLLGWAVVSARVRRTSRQQRC